MTEPITVKGKVERAFGGNVVSFSNSIPVGAEVTVTWTPPTPEPVVIHEGLVTEYGTVDELIPTRRGWVALFTYAEVRRQWFATGGLPLPDGTYAEWPPPPADPVPPTPAPARWRVDVGETYCQLYDDGRYIGTWRSDDHGRDAFVALVEQANRP